MPLSLTAIIFMLNKDWDCAMQFDYVTVHTHTLHATHSIIVTFAHNYDTITVE